MLPRDWRSLPAHILQDGLLRREVPSALPLRRAAVYAASIRATSATLTITQRGRFDAKLVRVDLRRVWMQRLSESLARVAYFSILPGRTSIAFAAQAGPIVISGGFEQDGFSIVRRDGGQQYFHRTSAASCNCAMSLPVSVRATNSMSRC